ncbi:hypothetical protein H2248_010058 [Termitomyces sp. 'cryptogamus']|nr:hypothetical protein H2248_010058 [Termitomyces sp. 'cryptogamus']
MYTRSSSVFKLRSLIILGFLSRGDALTFDVPTPSVSPHQTLVSARMSLSDNMNAALKQESAMIHPQSRNTTVFSNLSFRTGPSYVKVHQTAQVMINKRFTKFQTSADCAHENDYQHSNNFQPANSQNECTNK